VEELFQLVQQELRRSGFEDLLSSGIVLTGGASLMPGMVELAEEVFHMPVRVGVPKYVGGLAEVVKTPRFSTGVGCCCTARTRSRPIADPKWKARVWASCLAA
jgi:cell division protein FtsA